VRFDRINLTNGTAAGAILAVGMKEREDIMKMSSQTRCVFYAYPSSTYGGKNGGWISATYKNVLAVDPLEHKFFDDKENAIKHAENTWKNYPWDKYRHAA
jgi:hypothetical protein